jgi:hypothetical protein
MIVLMGDGNWLKMGWMRRQERYEAKPGLLNLEINPHKCASLYMKQSSAFTDALALKPLQSSAHCKSRFRDTQHCPDMRTYGGF